MTTEILVNEEVTELELVTPENSIQLTTTDTELILQEQTVDLSIENPTTQLQLLSQELTIQLTTQQGPAGSSEDQLVFAKRVDFIGDTLLYRAEAEPGTLDADNLWRIRRLTVDTNNDDDITTEWADGVASFTKIWDDRLTYTYI